MKTINLDDIPAMTIKRKIPTLTADALSYITRVAAAAHIVGSTSVTDDLLNRLKMPVFC